MSRHRGRIRGLVPWHADLLAVIEAGGPGGVSSLVVRQWGAAHGHTFEACLSVLKGAMRHGEVEVARKEAISSGGTRTSLVSIYRRIPRGTAEEAQS